MTPASSEHEPTRYETAGGIVVWRSVDPADPSELEPAIDRLDTVRGGVLRSGFDYPGRYSRFDIAWADPPLEVVARQRHVEVRPLSERGLVLLPALRRAFLGRSAIEVDEDGDTLALDVAEPSRRLSEEERSRRPTVFDALRVLLELFASPEDAHLGLYGAFGYDLVFQFENLTMRSKRPSDARDLVLHLPDELLIVDHKRELCQRLRYDFAVDSRTTVGLARTSPPAPASPGSLEVPPDPVSGAYAAVVAEAKDRFAAGDLFEVVPSQSFYRRAPAPSGVFRRLSAANPAPYGFLLNLGEGEHLVGASPEMYVRVEGDRVETCPIAGTVARGDDPLADAEQIRELLASTKEEAELTMCTDVDRNDKARVCLPGTVRVIGRRQIEIYSRLIHTVDHVEGRLAPGRDALDAFLSHLWAVTVTGAPKRWAMQFIEDHEGSPRRWYAGALGWVGFNGSMNTGLALRTAQIRQGVAEVRVGATLLFRSDPASEEAETALKARAVLEALEEPAPEPGEAPPEPPLANRRPTRPLRTLVVDHDDSFVLTLGDYLRQSGAAVTTLRHGFDTEVLDELEPELVVLSPGPGRPSDFATAALLDELERRDLSIFGVCLGLQAIAERAGAPLRRLDEPAHGVPTAITVHGGVLLDGFPTEMVVGRYHSLYVSTSDVPRGFRLGASGPPGVVMALEHDERPVWAVQFHPESIMSRRQGLGLQLIERVVALASAARERTLERPRP